PRARRAGPGQPLRSRSAPGRPATAYRGGVPGLGEGRGDPGAAGAPGAARGIPPAAASLHLPPRASHHHGADPGPDGEELPETAMTSVLAVVGPTASGKTALALALAERLETEIVSADSMQIYRGMEI